MLLRDADAARAPGARVTERADPHGSDGGVEADLADPGANTQPAEGGRDEVVELPGADTAAEEPAEEEPRDH